VRVTDPGNGFDASAGSDSDPAPDDTPVIADPAAEVDNDEALERSVTDVVAELIAPTPEDLSAPPLDMSGLRQLARLKTARARYKAMYDALKPVIEALEAELVDNVLPHRAPDGRWQATVGDRTGYLNTTYWPKRNVDESTGDPYSTQDLVKALRADSVDFLVADAVHGARLAAWVRERLAAWEQMGGEDGVRNSRGELVDADGEVLTSEEALDPTAPELALPRHVRKIISITADMKIAFRAR
jgi:hypothetical protein